MPTWKPDEKFKTPPPMRMLIVLKCKLCQAKVMHQDVDMMEMRPPRFERDRKGRLTYMGRLIKENVNCPECHIPVIIVEGVLNRGCHGSVTMMSIPPTKKVKPPEEEESGNGDPPPGRAPQQEVSHAG